MFVYIAERLRFQMKPNCYEELPFYAQNLSSHQSFEKTCAWKPTTKTHCFAVLVLVSVVNGLDGSPIPGASVSASGSGGDVSVGVTDADGVTGQIEADKLGAAAIITANAAVRRFCCKKYLRLIMITFVRHCQFMAYAQTKYWEANAVMIYSETYNYRTQPRQDIRSFKETLV